MAAKALGKAVDGVQKAEPAIGGSDNVTQPVPGASFEHNPAIQSSNMGTANDRKSSKLTVVGPGGDQKVAATFVANSRTDLGGVQMQ